MKNNLLLCFLSGLVLLFASCGNQARKERVISETVLRAAELFATDSSGAAFDSVSVISLHAGKDSLVYFKNDSLLGSSVIIYE